MLGKLFFHNLIFHKILSVATYSPIGLFYGNLEKEVDGVWIGLTRQDWIYLWGWNYLTANLISTTLLVDSDRIIILALDSLSST